MPQINLQTLIKFGQRSIQASVDRYHAKHPGERLSLTSFDNPEVQREVAAHPQIDLFSLGIPSNVVRVADLNNFPQDQLSAGRNVFLAGRVLSRDVIAGDASRVKKAPSTNPDAQYLLHKSKIFFTPEQLLVQATEANLIDQIPKDQRDADKYLPYNLASIRFFKMALEVYNMALQEEKTETEAIEAIKKQVRLIILPAEYWEEFVEEAEKNNFYGFDPSNIFFMIQESLPGFNIDGEGKVVVDPNAPKKKWNHGSLPLQQAIPGEIFRARFISGQGVVREEVSIRETDEVFSRMEDVTSFNVENMGSIKTGKYADLEMISVAIKAREEEGAQFLMEPTSQNMKVPQKGGFLAYNKSLGAKMFETSGSGFLIDLSLEGEELADELRRIEYLNRNCNHDMAFLHQIELMRQGFQAIENGTNPPIEEGLFGIAHTELKGGYLYPQMPQGDANLSLRTVYVAKKPMPQITDFKVQANIPFALDYWYIGSRQKGLTDFINEVLAGNI